MSAYAYQLVHEHLDCALAYLDQAAGSLDVSPWQVEGDANAIRLFEAELELSKAAMHIAWLRDIMSEPAALALHRSIRDALLRIATSNHANARINYHSALERCRRDVDEARAVAIELLDRLPVPFERDDVDDEVPGI